MNIVVLPTPRPRANGKVAEIELHFGEEDGLLAGWRLIGFSIWERMMGPGFNIVFPSRQYSVNGERRSFALLRPLSSFPADEDRLKRQILDAYLFTEGAGAEDRAPEND